MNQALVDAMRTYLKAGPAMDVDALDRLCDPGFQNVRVDPDSTYLPHLTG